VSEGTEVYSVHNCKCPACEEKFSKIGSERFFKCFNKKCHVVLFTSNNHIALGNFGEREEWYEPPPREEKPYEPGS
jgi:tRNA(Ile2) C34 agmatinyltransferase TiaS